MRIICPKCGSQDWWVFYEETVQVVRRSYHGTVVHSSDMWPDDKEDDDWDQLFDSRYNAEIQERPEHLAKMTVTADYESVDTYEEVDSSGDAKLVDVECAACNYHLVSNGLRDSTHHNEESLNRITLDFY